ncbi:MAG: MoaD/ThiS family protein [Chloroflexi bacterium]|nr:MoaD/ThiS family protein [Chloroflexota bacterium]
MVRIHVTAYGDLRRYIPAEQRDSDASLTLPAGATVMQMLDALRLPYQNTWLIGVNDAVVDLEHALSDGDRVELMMPIGGGGAALCLPF